MATEEYKRPSSLPPYPQMIMEALDALNPSEGANKSTISKFMETKYGEMPCGHSDLLSHHLNMMKDSGELVFIKNNYLKPGPGAPLKRGRGRPPKAKEPLPPGTIPAPLDPEADPGRTPMPHLLPRNRRLLRAPRASPRLEGLGEGQER